MTDQLLLSGLEEYSCEADACFLLPRVTASSSCLHASVRQAAGGNGGRQRYCGGAASCNMPGSSKRRRCCEWTPVAVVAVCPACLLGIASQVTVSAVQPLSHARLHLHPLPKADKTIAPAAAPFGCAASLTSCHRQSATRVDVARPYTLAPEALAAIRAAAQIRRRSKHPRVTSKNQQGRTTQNTSRKTFCALLVQSWALSHAQCPLSSRNM